VIEPVALPIADKNGATLMILSTGRPSFTPELPGFHYGQFSHFSVLNLATDQFQIAGSNCLISVQAAY
jgi:hypothetical protein